MEIACTQQETVGITELIKSLGTYIDKLETVIVPIAQYEHMKKALDYIEVKKLKKDYHQDIQKDLELLPDVVYDEAAEYLIRISK